jgi:hypothetical protein
VADFKRAKDGNQEELIEKIVLSTVLLRLLKVVVDSASVLL